MKTFKRLFKYMWQFKGYLGLVFIFAILSTIFSLISFAFFIPVFEILFKTKEFVAETPEPLSFTNLNGEAIKDNFYYFLNNIVSQFEPKTALLYIILIIIGLFLFKDIFRYLTTFCISPIRQGVLKIFRNELYHKLLILPLSFYSKRKKGDIVSRMTADVHEIEISVMSSLEIFVIEPITILLYITTLIIISPRLTIFALVLMPVSGYIIGKIGSTLKGYASKGQSKLGSLVAYIEESIDGISIIKGFNAINHTNKNFNKKNDEYTNTMVKLLRIRDIASPLGEFLGVCLVVAAVWYGGSLVLSDNSPLPASELIVYIVIFSQLLPPIKSISRSYSDVKKGAASMERINEILEAEEVITEKRYAIEVQPFEDDIQFLDVSFKYEDQYALRNINVTFKKGKKIALVGPSGAGKTTIMNLLPRFYDCTEGDILIDGMSIVDLRINELRNLFGIVTQDTILFNDTVIGNITFGLEDYNKEDVIQAAKMANAHDFIMELPDGYDTIIGDRGSKLSGGQRQRISIARALLRNPQILLLDEATSALDTESEKAVQDALEKLMASRTSIVIAHRLSTIINSDEILVIDNGRIVEQGTHKELYARDGLYTKLCNMQAL